MAKSLVKKSVVATAAKIVAEAVQPQPAQPRPNLPLVGVLYPRHGAGTLTKRIVRVTECDSNYLRGFEVTSEDDTTSKEYKVFLRRKISGPIEFLALNPVTE